MPVKVRDVLNLKLMSSYRIVAGHKGLDKEVRRINFFDCQLQDDEIDNKLVMPNDFFITSFYIYKNSIDEMKKIIEFYINTKSSGVCIINEYIQDIPDEIKKIADNNRFPVIFIDTNVPYAEIIRITTEMILLEKIELISELLIDKLMNTNINKEEIKDLALKINGEFKNFYVVLSISHLTLDKDNLESMVNDLNRNYDFKALKYKHHLIIIVNFDKESMLKANISYIRSVMDKYGNNCIIGVSNTFSNIDEFNIAIKQAESASDMSDIINKDVIFYKNLNVYKLLYPLKDNRELKEYYSEIIEPLIEYDKYYNSNLIETIESFIENDGNYKKTAEELYLHENTVRFRILKAQKILDLEDNYIQFIEQIYIGLKIKNILNKREKLLKKELQKKY